MAQALSMSKLSYMNLKRKPFRTVALVLVVVALSFVLFSGMVLSVSLKNGLNNVKARFGADLIVVPTGYEGAQESILLTGEPSCFYFKKSFLDRIKDAEGISKLTAQFYLTTLGEACCDLPVQIIGFDPATDFSIQPWIRETIGGKIEDGALIVGSDIHIGDHYSVKFYGKEYPVAAKLDETGTGLDQSVFATTETIKDLFTRAKEKGMNFLSDANPDASISSILIKVEDGYAIEQVISNILKTVEGIQIIRTQNIIAGITKSLGSLDMFLHMFSAAFLVLTLVILTLVFSVTANERKKEFATLRILGATRKKLAGILLRESLYISVTGGIIGIALSVLFIFPFNVFIENTLKLPYIQPSVPLIVVILAGTLIISIAIGPIASAKSAAKISRAETYITLREGE